jgi:hypothetical protein
MSELAEVNKFVFGKFMFTTVSHFSGHYIQAFGYTPSQKSFKILMHTYKVHLEYHSVCPLVGNETTHPQSPTSECAPLGTRGGGGGVKTFLRWVGLRRPNKNESR